MTILSSTGSFSQNMALFLSVTVVKGMHSSENISGRHFQTRSVGSSYTTCWRQPSKREYTGAAKASSSSTHTSALQSRPSKSGLSVKKAYTASSQQQRENSQPLPSLTLSRNMREKSTSTTILK